MRFAHTRYTTLAAAAASVLAASGASAQGRAQNMQVAQVDGLGGSLGLSLEPPPVDSGRPNVFERPGRADDAMVVGSWLLYPSAFGGFIYDTNVNQGTSGKGGSSVKGVSSPGMDVAPSLLAQQDDGLFKTTLYGNADGRFYFRNVPSGGQVISARAGATETYKPLPDVIINGQADYTRQQDLFSTLGTDQTVATLNPTGVGLAPTANPASYDQLSMAASIQKNFARSFVSVGGSAVDISYGTSSGTAAASPSGVTYTGIGRGGFWIVPALYVYVEGGADSRDYQTQSLSSTGYRVITGLGTDRVGLMRGEIYVGYQAETYNGPGIGTVGSPVFGVRGHYYPLPELTLNLSIDEAIGVSAQAPQAPTLTSTAGSSTRVDTALLTADYSLSQQWSATGRGGYIRTEYVGAGRRDDAWTIGGTLTYNFFRNVGLTFDYQHIDLSSSVVAQGFTRDVVTIGATYRY